MPYQRRVVKRRPARLNDEEWLTLLNQRWLWPPPSVEYALTRDWPELDRHVLCFHCREVHLASEVEKCMSLPMRKASAGVSTSSTSNVSVGELLKPFSEVWEFLTATKYPDGTKRRTGRLSVSCESGTLRLSLTDEETGLYASMTGSSLDDLLLAFEAGLAANEIDWRTSKYSKGKRA